MKLSRLISGALVSLAVMSLAGCANTMYDMRAALGNTMLPGGAPFSGLMEKTPSEAVIYIYRPVGWAEVPDVLVNKSNLSALAEGAFFCPKITAGPVSNFDPEKSKSCLELWPYRSDCHC